MQPGFDLLLFLVFLASCGASAATGAMFQPGAWYQGLRKPVWTPPSFVFPLVWTTLYILMSWAAMRVAQLPGTGLALGLFAAQIAFNVLWTPVFFGLQRMRAALGVMAALWVSVAATTGAFFMADATAGWLFAPYLLWVSIAAALNASVLRLNPEQAG